MGLSAPLNRDSTDYDRELNDKLRSIFDVGIDYDIPDAVVLDKSVTLDGDARVVKYEWIPAQGLAAHGGQAATWTTFSNDITAAWSFADGSDNTITFSMKVPDDIDFTEPSYLCVGWSSPVVSGDCYWYIEYLITKVDDDTDGAATDSSGNLYPTSSTADGMRKDNMLTIAADTFDADSLCIHGAITRDISKDALGDVAYVHGVTLMYTASKLGEAL